MPPGGVHLDRLEIGEQDPPFVDAHLLLAVEELAGADLQRIVDAVEHAAQDDLHELVDEERRRAHVGVEQAPVARLERVGGEQALAELEPDLQVGAGVRVLDGIELARGDRLARRVQQRLVQGDLTRPRFLHRAQLRPQQIGAEEIVGDAKAARAAALQQMEAGVAPEILGHAARGRARRPSGW